MPRPYDITIFSTTGDPSGVRHVSKSNWSGLAVVFPRDKYNELTPESCLDHAGVYILVGDAAEETIYIGEADPVGNRLKGHLTRKNWSWCVYFVEKHGFIGKTEIKYIESALISIAKENRRALVENKNDQNMPSMSSVNRARAQAFLEDMLLILPLLGIRAFTKPSAAPDDHDEEQASPPTGRESGDFDTIVVPAREEGFQQRFLGENRWFAIRINRKHIPKIQYIAAYQVAPVGAITHYAEIKTITPYNDSGKYMLTFKAAAREIGPIPRGESSITMQSPRYASLQRITKAACLDDIWP